MTKNYHIFLGWGLAIAVTMATVIGLPKLAGASTTLKDQARWQERAGNLQKIGADFESSSNYAKDLANTHLDGTITSAYRLDYLTASNVGTNGQDMISSAKQQSREVHCLAEAVYYEARSETTTGQKAVAEVVLNRVGHKAFPNTICAVVYQGSERTSGCQFSFACDGSNAKLPYGKHWDKAQSVAAHMMIGASSPITNRATHYHTTDVNPKWAPSLRKLRQYDTHVFYRFMPRKRRLRAVSVAP